MNQKVNSVASEHLQPPAGSVAKSTELAAQLKARLDASSASGTVNLDRDLAAALWAQLLGNADLLRSLLAQKKAALNIDGQVFHCSQELHDVLVPILQERMTRIAQEEINRDLASLRDQGKR